MNTTRIVALLGLALCVTPSCVSDPVTGALKYSLVEWTAEEELEIGRKFAPNIEAQFDSIYPDLEANESLRKLMRDMVDLSPRKQDFEFQFKILNSSIPNALALPGGYVYITRGLLQELETEAQFISVMGHELGHVEHRHAMLNQSSGALLNLPLRPLKAVARILPIGRGVANLAVSLIAAPSELLGLKFNRDQELEADERGVYFAAKMGYDPRDAKHTFELFARLEAELPASERDFAIFRTHPVNEDRIQKIDKTIERDYAELSGASDAQFLKNSSAFDAILARLRGKAPAYELYDQAKALMGTPGPDAAEAAMVIAKEARSVCPEEPLFHMLEGELALMLEDLNHSVECFESAIELYNQNAPGEGHWKAHLFLGVLDMQARNWQSAYDHLNRSGELFPINGEIQYLLGQSCEETGRIKGAVEAYERAMELLPAGSQRRSSARDRLRDLDD